MTCSHVHCVVYFYVNATTAAKIYIYILYVCSCDTIHIQINAECMNKIYAHCAAHFHHLS